jgi:hypothetical protein
MSALREFLCLPEKEYRKSGALGRDEDTKKTGDARPDFAQ